jgi:hypothetical protein
MYADVTNVASTVQKQDTTLGLEGASVIMGVDNLWNLYHVIIAPLSI